MALFPGARPKRAEVLQRQTQVVELVSAGLDALQDRLWDKAMAGDVRSIGEIRRIVMNRCRLLSLDSGEPGRKPVGATSVVLPSFWQHMTVSHPDDWRECRCPEIVREGVNEAEFMWPG